jgi:hypothetical protein
MVRGQRREGELLPVERHDDRQEGGERTNERTRTADDEKAKQATNRDTGKKKAKDAPSLRSVWIHARCENCESTDTPRTSVLIFLNSS